MSILKRIKALQTGYSEVSYNGEKYRGIKNEFNEGDRLKVYAEELGGNNFISLNYYIAYSGEKLKPCEMEDEKVIHFLNNYS